MKTIRTSQTTVDAVDLDTENVFGFINMARKPYRIAVNTNPRIPLQRQVIALVHELLHGIAYTYKMPLKHEQLHTLAVNFITEIVPAVSKFLQEKGTKMDFDEILDAAASSPDSGTAASAALLGLIENLQKKGLAQVKGDIIGVYDDDDEDNEYDEGVETEAGDIVGVYDEAEELAADLVMDMFDLEFDTCDVDLDEFDPEELDEVDIESM